MTNHPKRSRSPYTAYLGGASWSRGPQAEFCTIREARAWAESYGTEADWCVILAVNTADKVGEHHRDTTGTGTRWFRVAG